MTFDDVCSYMTSHGWPVESLGPAAARSGFPGLSRQFSFFVRMETAFLILYLVPYVRIPLERQRAETLMRRLLHINREMNLAKFSVDADGDVALSVEYRAADLDPSELQDALNALSYYAEEYWTELVDLAGPLTPSVFRYPTATKLP